MELIVGPQMRQCLVDGGVEPRGHQRILQPAARALVVMHVVGRNQRNAHLAGDARQLAVADRIPLQKVLLKLDVDGIGAVPGRIVAQ